MYRQILAPVSGSLALSSIFAALPLVTLFVLLGLLKVKAWIAGLVSLAVALVVAVLVYSMPVGQALLSASEGATFGFFPILWIVLNAIWVYNLTVASGHFDVLRRSFERVSADQRIQAIIIAFCFGALLEALAGFGTPVAITVAMLMALGFRPVRAAAVALIANTAPVAFGALATPIVTLATVTHGVNPDKQLNVDTLGSMVGRQTPILAAVVPLVLVLVVDGRRGVRQTWLPAVLCGVAFGATQFVVSNYVSVQLTDIVASLVAAAAIVALVRVWHPVEPPVLAEAAPARAAAATVGARGDAAGAGIGARSGPSGADGGPGGGTRGEAVARSARPTSESPDVGVASVQDSRGEIAKAYAPYLIIIAILVVANLNAVKDALAKSPFTLVFSWPGLHVVNTQGKPLASLMFSLSWLASPGTLMVLAGILSAIVLRVSPARALRIYGETYAELRWAIVTVMAVLSLAYVMNQSGQTVTLGSFLAQTGSVFVFLSPILGWLGVAVTGSDTSSNALFGALQVQTAAKAGLDPLLLAAANSSGGVLGKMISPQNLAIAAGAVGMAGHEGVIFRRVLLWSLILLLLMCLLVTLQATPVLSWMVP
jgi:lactate permease